MKKNMLIRPFKIFLLAFAVIITMLSSIYLFKNEVYIQGEYINSTVLAAEKITETKKEELVDKEQVKEDLVVEKIQDSKATNSEKFLKTPKSTIAVFAIALGILGILISVTVIVHIIRKGKLKIKQDA